MSIQQAYNSWASQYDTNENKTRDMEAVALRETLDPLSFDNCLEIGCGTGKNTSWLIKNAKQVLAVDFSEKMLAKAKARVSSTQVEFKQADINQPWEFGQKHFDLITFSLVLEHIEQLDHIFLETVAALKPGGHVYIGELHPFKQYIGSKARFDTEKGQQVVDCFNHHVSDFTGKALRNGLTPVSVNEYFDDNNRKGIPRLLVLLFRKQ